jgi:peptidylprolyl isomerase
MPAVIGRLSRIGICAALAVGMALAIAGCGDDESTGADSETTEAAKPAESAQSAPGKKPTVTVPDGAPSKKLQERDLIEGDGAVAKSGDEVTVHYVGVGYESGEEFDASWDRGEPFPFALGAGEVISGWDQGVEGMKVGGRRELTIPPSLAYGPAGSPPAIGPNETLVFVVDLLAVK